MSQSNQAGGSLSYYLVKSLDASNPSEKRHSLVWAASFDRRLDQRRHPAVSCQQLTLLSPQPTLHVTR